MSMVKMIQESTDGQKAFKNTNAPVYAVFKLGWPT